MSGSVRRNVVAAAACCRLVCAATGGAQEPPRVRVLGLLDGAPTGPAKGRYAVTLLNEKGCRDGARLRP